MQNNAKKITLRSSSSIDITANTMNEYLIFTENKISPLQRYAVGDMSILTHGIGKLSASENMEMQVRNALAGIASAI